jgi:hypothetical protein
MQRIIYSIRTLQLFLQNFPELLKICKYIKHLLCSHAMHYLKFTYTSNCPELLKICKYFAGGSRAHCIMPDKRLSSGCSAGAREEAENLLNLRKQVRYRRSNSYPAVPHHHHRNKRTINDSVKVNRSGTGIKPTGRKENSSSQAKILILDSSKHSPKASRTGSPKSPGLSFVKSMCRFYSDIFVRKSPGSPCNISAQLGRQAAAESLSVSFTKTTLSTTAASPEQAGEREMTKIFRRSRSFDLRGCAGPTSSLQPSAQPVTDTNCSKLIQTGNNEVSSLGRKQQYRPRKGGLTSFFVTEVTHEDSMQQRHLTAAQGTTLPCAEPVSSDLHINAEQDKNIGMEETKLHDTMDSIRSRSSTTRLSPEGQCAQPMKTGCQRTSNQDQSVQRRPRPVTRLPRVHVIKPELKSPEMVRDCASSHRRRSLQLSPIGYSEHSGRHYLLRLGPEGGECGNSSRIQEPPFSVHRGRRRSDEDRERSRGGSLRISCHHDKSLDKRLSLHGEDVRATDKDNQRLEITVMSHSPAAPSQDSGFSDSGDSLSDRGGSLPRAGCSLGSPLPPTASSSGGCEGCPTLSSSTSMTSKSVVGIPQPITPLNSPRNYFGSNTCVSGKNALLFN